MRAVERTGKQRGCFRRRAWCNLRENGQIKSFLAFGAKGGARRRERSARGPGAVEHGRVSALPAAVALASGLRQL